MIDLRTTIAGVPLDHPLVLASGPLSHDGEAMIRAHRAGAAAVVTKTISREAAVNPIPCIAHVEGGLINVERWSDLPPEAWIAQEIPRAKAAGVRVIASLGLTAADAEALAGSVERAGADLLEVVSYRAADLPEMVAAAASNASIPVLAKISANWADPPAVAEACVEHGAAGITAIDSVGPALRIDLRARRPLIGPGWMTGPSILPTALRVVFEVSKRVSVPVIATGGVGSADHVLEALMAGGSAVGVCTLPLVQGLGVFATLRAAMVRRMEELRLDSVRDLIAAAGAAPAWEERHEPILDWNASRCIGCRICVERCPYGARPEPQRATQACCRCGLCVTLCPTGALAWKGRDR